MLGHPRLGTPSPLCRRCNSPCSKFWRGAIHFFLLLILMWEPITKLAFPPARYWLSSHNDNREATASSQLRTESFELRRGSRLLC